MKSGLNSVTEESKLANVFFLKQFLGELKRYPGLTVVGGFFCLLLITLHLSGIPPRFAASTFLQRYAAVGLQSISYALILGAIQFPRDLLWPMKERYQKSPLRLLIVILLAVLFFSLYPVLAACVFLLIGVAILEGYERQLSPMPLAKALLPAVYLFIGLATVFGFNAVIVSIRTPNYSNVVAKIDSILLLGHSVSELSHRFCAAAPHLVVNALMISYFALFAQIGAVLLLTTLLAGQSTGMKFVSTILIAYLITMAVFAALPSYSPYFSCPDHANSKLPGVVLEAQQNLMAQASLRQVHASIPIDTEYYVAFPCMHIAQPLIALWFVRKWRRIFATLVVVDYVLAFAIVLLEWHYLADLLGGLAVAAFAIAISSTRKEPPGMS